jgi:murein DD-endopeptidase MepM/ murein hydrolase activator NlpD
MPGRRLPYMQGLTAGLLGIGLSAILVHSISSALAPGSGGLTLPPPERSRWLPSTAAFAAPMPTPGRFDLASALPAPHPAPNNPTPAWSPLHLHHDLPAYGTSSVLPPGTDSLTSPDTALGRRFGGLIEQVVQVQRGDTLLALLAEAGIDRTEAHEAIDALGQAFAPSDLRPGQEITLSLSADDDEAAHRPSLQLVGLTLQPSVERDVRLQRDLDGGFTVETFERPLSLWLTRAASVIDSSLFAAGQAADTPPAVLTEVIRAFSYDVDFQRDIQAGDDFEVVYERYDDDRGNLARIGNVLFARLTLSGREIALYRFDPSQGPPDYFTPDGESVRKALLRTPIDGARISSTFGMRKHPILGFSKMHKGIDFSAPQGTPIYAAGDGQIVRMGRNGGYGNYILIRHNNRYATAYAHMSRFAAGLRVGSRVRQGQVIAYVGSTGRSTGPHLHYEVLVAGKQINPQSIVVPAGQKLAGRDLEAFRAARAQIDRMRERLRQNPLLLVVDRPE